MTPKCLHGDSDRYPNGKCRICERARNATPSRRAAFRANNARPERRAYRYKFNLDRTYGKGAADWYAEHLIKQGDRCANLTCRKTVIENGRALALDHDHGCHYCGGVGCSECWRALLCNTCNVTAHSMLHLEIVAGLLAVLRNHQALVEERAA